MSRCYKTACYVARKDRSEVLYVEIKCECRIL